MRCRPALEEAALLGRRVEELWRVEGCGPDAFARAALRALQDRRPELRIGVDAIVEASLRARVFPRQFSLHSLFGEPPVTLYWSPRFVIEAFFWLKPDVSIHDHMFSGAFCVLEGRSLHCEYSFEPEREREGGLRFGRLSPRRLELLRPGDARRIDAGPRFIHGVWHLSRPSLTLLVRTHQEGEVQRNYFPEGLAVDYQAAKWRPLLAPIVQKRLALIKFLGRCDPVKRERYARELLASCTLAEAFLYLECCMLSDPSAPALTGVIEEAVARHGQDLALIAHSLRRQRRIRAVDWDRVREPLARLKLALGFCGAPSAEVARLLRELSRFRA